MAVGIESNSRPIFEVAATKRSDGSATTARADGVVLVSATTGEPASLGTTSSSTATQSNVTGAATSTNLLAANASRQGATIWNDSAAILYVLLGTGTASATVCTVKMIADAYYEVPAGYTGAIKGIWASATGAARITELT